MGIGAGGFAPFTLPPSRLHRLLTPSPLPQGIHGTIVTEPSGEKETSINHSPPSSRAAQRSADVLRFDPHTPGAEGFAEFHEIRVHQLRADVPAAEHPVPILANGAERIVVEHQLIRTFFCLS